MSELTTSLFRLSEDLCRQCFALAEAALREKRSADVPEIQRISMLLQKALADGLANTGRDA